MTSETDSPAEATASIRDATSKPPLRLLGADAVVCEGDSCFVPTGTADQA